MRNVSAATANNNDSGSKQRRSRERSDTAIALHLCYGEIGISAVAAAARYQGSAKNPAYAPAAITTDDRHGTGA